MFGGAPRASKEELEAQTFESQNAVLTSLCIGAALWFAPFAIELVRGRF